MEDHLDTIVEQWGHERPDLDVSALAVLGRLFRFAHLADVRLAKGLAKHDIQPGWLDLLAALRRAGPPYELNPTELMRATLLSSGGMTKRLDRLAEQRLIARRPDPTDRRGTLVRLTQHGKALIDQAIATHIDGEEKLLAHLSDPERRQLDGLLRKLLESLDSDPQG